MIVVMIHVPKKSISYLLIFLLFFTSCNIRDDFEMKIKGCLVYTGGGNEIKILDFNKATEPEPVTLYKNPKITQISQITKKTNNVIYFQEWRRRKGNCIKECIIDLKKTKIIRSGRLPVYIHERKSLFYYDKISKNKAWLLESSIHAVEKGKKIAPEPKKKLLPNGLQLSLTEPVIQLSTKKILFYGDGEQLWIYDTEANKLEPLDIRDCRPVFWMDKKALLFCYDIDTWMPLLLNLKTKEKTEIKKLKGAYGIVYIPETDTIIYGKSRYVFPIGEGSDIYMYSFNDKEEVKIKSNAHIKSGIWISW